MMSLGIGEDVSSIDSKAYKACISLSAQGGKCVEPLKLVTTGRLSTTAEQCQYSRNNSVVPTLITRFASCGYSETGSSFCSLGLGDLVYELETLSRNYFGLDPVCHYSEFLTFGCTNAYYFQALGFPASLARAMYLLGDSFLNGTPYSISSVLVQDNADCTKMMATLHVLEETWRRRSRR